MVARAESRPGLRLEPVPTPIPLAESTTRTEPVRHPLLHLLRYIAQHRRHALITVFFGTAGFLLAFAYPWIIGTVVDVLATNRPDAKERILRLAVLGVLTALAHAAVVYGRGHFNVHLGNGVIADIRRALFAHIQKLSVRFFSRERTGSILARIIQDVHEATALVYTGVIVVVLDAAQLVLAFVLLSGITWKLTVACLLLFPLYAIVFFVMNPRVRAASERMHLAFARISGNLSEQLAGQALIKTYTAETREAKRFSDAISQHHELVVSQSHVGHIVAALGEVLVHLGTTIVFAYGGWLALRGEITPGEMTRFLGYMLIMFGPVRRFAELNITYQSSLSAMRRVFRVLTVTPSIVDPPNARTQPPYEGRVVLENVRFRYDDQSNEAHGEENARPSTPPGAWVLDGVSLEARPGERVAIVGPSGAGKTTLVSLLPRLYDVRGGRILIDGTDVRDYSLRALRSGIGIVQQDSFLFSGTIRENIAYGVPEATLEEVMTAAKAAHAHEFIARLPDGYDSILGERGVNLSGGQRQRLSIARALLKDPRILILDEATSSLDTESEAIVQRALDKLMEGRTSFVVAHRLSTIKSADRIVVLDGGRIAEIGSHEELVRRNGVYARLVRQQTSLKC